jgi:hypothetical protein
MADTKISALTAVTTPATTDEFAVNQGGTSKKMTLAQIEDFIQPVIASNSGALVNTIGVTTRQLITSNNSDITTNTLVTQLTGTGMGAGWWLVEYFILWQSNVTSTGITFHVDHSGTAANSQWTREDMVGSSTSLATVGVANQANSAISTSGGLPSNWTARSDAADLGPNAGVDVINVNQFSRVTGLLLVTASGDLALRAKSEIVSTTTRVVAGTTARYTRLS